MNGAAFAPVDPGTHVVLGTGPVGRAVARELLAHDVAGVRLASRSGTVDDPTLTADPRVTVRAADLSDDRAAVVACEGAASVTFALAPPYHRWVDLFPALQTNAVRAAGEGGAVLVSVENLYAYGGAGMRASPLTERTPFSATTRKGRVRASMSDDLLAAHERGDVRAVAGRASDLFGPDMRVSALGERVWPPLLAGRPIDWLGDPAAIHTHTYLPDFARALVRLGAGARVSDDVAGRAWHVPSPPARSVRDVLTRAAALAGLPTPRIRRVPRLVLRTMGLVSPTLREVAEMAYQFDAPFVMDASDYEAAFGERATEWDDALRTTLRGWDAVIGASSTAEAIDPSRARVAT